jgi:hypothetical protein
MFAKDSKIPFSYPFKDIIISRRNQSEKVSLKIIIFGLLSLAKILTGEMELNYASNLPKSKLLFGKRKFGKMVAKKHT